jgi:hypothetical protein
MLPASVLPAGEILAVDMNRRTVDWAEAVSIQVREWTSNDGMMSFFKVMAVCAPRIKARYGGESGVLHLTGA